MNKNRKAALDYQEPLSHMFNLFYSALELRTSSNQLLASFVASELLEVLDEAASQVFCFLFPLASAVVSVARIEDLRIYARQFGRNYEVEARVSRMEIRLPVPFQPVLTR